MWVDVVIVVSCCIGLVMLVFNVVRMVVIVLLLFLLFLGCMLIGKIMISDLLGSLFSLFRKCCKLFLMIVNVMLLIVVLY